MFNKRPINRVDTLRIELASEYKEVLPLVAKLADSDEPVNTLLIDGTHGADFEGFAAKLAASLEERSIRTAIIRTRDYLRSGEELRQQFAENITDNRAFGRVTASGTIADYFRPTAPDEWREEKLKQGRLASGAGGPLRIILLGPGARWLEGGRRPGVFLDVSRERQQRLYEGELLNFGLDENEDALEKYKIAFFVEWPIVERYRKEHLERFDFYVDMNDPESPVATGTGELLRLIAEAASAPMRVKPFFAPGVWGGQYLKRLAGLPEQWDNCAWCFEPIAPENSILLGSGEKTIEIPFTLVMNSAYRTVLGDRVSGLFGDFFPIRMNYLDTMGGSNLSVQVHPKQEYIRERFNYILEQQESYYMMEQKPGSKVYLGLTESCTEERFLAAVADAQMTGTPFDFTEYVQEWECEKGDLFLIPTGTVHCSGSDNFVLEISATTWWFTFKLYDYVRPGLDGKPRPIDIGHAAPNIDWHKQTDWVGRELIARPALLSRQGANEEYALGRREDLLFYVNRIHLAEQWTDDTRGEVLLLNLVEGQRVRLEPIAAPDKAVELDYAESYIVPAAVGAYRLINLGSAPAKLIKAGVSPQWERAVAYE
ncbi:class I mannose-6-phosphate isomerase [Cohnella fermenti]|uniref:Mannose-6-phosphate isomerase n=1 Tax=Cohnella fermenti TaxID=2565925 RepID=A0A4S4BF58_9BACL|nr:class I mannose-6-phosphate isomerase [Cohnella fermenti]THF72911.1 mannose-6-phosphate isomerase [Cohnella fermenti]